METLGMDGFCSAGSWAPPGSGANFPEPFMDLGSLAIPSNVKYALRWCEFLCYANGTLSAAINRVVSYFLTDFELSDIKDDAEKEKISDYLHDASNGVDLMDDLHTMALNRTVYGNDFASVIMPFKRYLTCAQCGMEMAFNKLTECSDFKFKWSDFEFHAYCPRCHYKGPWQHTDRQLGGSSKINIKHWSPHEIEILWDPYTDNMDYLWLIPEDYRRQVKEGKLFHLERANWEVIQAIKSNSHLRFDKDIVFHSRENTLCGVRNRGWGVSRLLSSFKQAWYVQVLSRYNEAIALDYVIPFRLITPAPGPGSGDQARDMLMNLNAGGYMNRIQGMLAARRRDPARWHTLPFAVQYQALGGDAEQFAPRDMLDQGLEVLLNNLGVPVELYKGSLQVQSAPAALRLFEAQWSHLVHDLNGYIGFIMKRLRQLLGWEKATAKLQKVTHADDIQRQMAKLQMMIGGQVSKQTGLASVGINYFDEEKRKSNETKFEAKEQDETQQELQDMASMGQMGQPPQDPSQGGDPSQAGAAGGGGAPGGAPGGAGMPPGSANAIASQPTIDSKPQTPQALEQKSQTIAQRILSLPEAQKDSELIQLKKTDSLMHSLVTTQLDDIKQQARTQGGAMLMQQTFNKQGLYLPFWILMDDWQPNYDDPTWVRPPRLRSSRSVLR